MQRLGISLMLVAIGLWTGCGKDDPAPADVTGPTDTTICVLLKLDSRIPTIPQNDYTLDFKYDSNGRLDSTMVNWVDVHAAVKFHYSLDDNPDSVSVSFTYPPNLVGGGYRIYFGYDNARRQLSATKNGYRLDLVYNSYGQIATRTADYLINGVHQVFTSVYSYPNSSTHNYSSAGGSLPNGNPAEPAVYTWDKHPLPHSFPFGVPFEVGYQPGTDNNLLRGWSASGGVEYVYTYNSAGYPIRQAFGSNGFAAITYTYQCVTIPKP